MIRAFTGFARLLGRTRTSVLGSPGIFSIVLAALISAQMWMWPQDAWSQPANAGYQPAEWAKIVAAAKTEGTVVIYSQITPVVIERLRADFPKLYPDIRFELSRIITIIPKVEEERKSGSDGADIVVISEPLWIEGLAKSGALKTPVGPSAPAWPANYMVARVAPVLLVEPFIIAYNTRATQANITGYQDLLKPELKGKLGTVEIVSSTVVAWYDWLEKTQGGDFLAKMAAQAPRRYVSSPPLNNALASGEIAASAFSGMSAATAMAATGAPIKVVVPRPSFAYWQAAGVLAWSKRPNAALVAMDYLMSARAQTLWHNTGTSASVLPNIPGSMDARAMQLADMNKYTPEVVKAYTERWNGMFTAR